MRRSYPHRSDATRRATVLAMHEPEGQRRGGGAVDALTVALTVFFASLLLVVGALLFLPGLM